MPSGTDCRLKAKLKMEIDPCGIFEASAMRIKIVRLFNESVNVRGREINTTRLISEKFILNENLGKNRS